MKERFHVSGKSVGEWLIITDTGVIVSKIKGPASAMIAVCAANYMNSPEYEKMMNNGWTSHLTKYLDESKDIEPFDT